VDLAETGWLSLKILEAEDRVGARRTLPAGRQASPLRISVPKKVVRLATRRNRIKRLIREAWRVGAPACRTGRYGQTPLQKDSNKVYAFRVEKMPSEELGLKDVQAAIKNLLC